MRHTQLRAPRCAEFDPVGRDPQRRVRYNKVKSLQEQHLEFRARVVRARQGNEDVDKRLFCKRFGIAPITLDKFMSDQKTFHKSYMQAAKTYKPPQPVELVCEMRESGHEFCGKCSSWKPKAEFRRVKFGLSHKSEVCSDQ